MRQIFYLYVKACSDFGSMVDSIVLTAMILNWTHSAVWVSWSLAARTFGGLLSSLSSGHLADRWNRRLLMIGSDVLRTLSLGIILIFPTPLVLVGVCFALGFFGSYFSTSFNASIPDLYGEGSAFKVNALIGRLSAISLVAGFFGAGILSTTLGYRFVIALDGLSFLLSAATLLGMSWITNRGNLPAPTAHERSWHIGEQFTPALRYLRTQPLLCLILFVLLVQTFGASAHNLGIPLLASKLAPTHSTLVYGSIWGVWGLGNVLITVLLPRLAFVRRRPYVAYLIGSAFCSAGFISFLVQSSLWMVFPLAFITGIFDGAIGTLAQTLLQLTEPNVRGRVFGVSTLLNRLGFGIGFIVAPMVLQATGLARMVSVFHGSVIAVILLGSGWMWFYVRKYPSEEFTRAV